MKKNLTALAFVFIALFTGCATADKLNDIHIGMTKDQVTAILGKPDSTSAQANIEYLTYYLNNDANYGRDRPYSVRLVEGKVESFGRFTQLFDIYNRPITGAPQNPMGLPTTTMPLSTVAPDLASQLQQLKTLKDQGVLTDSEFQQAKQKLLANPK